MVFEARGEIMINILKAEFYKIKHTWLPWAHLVLPIVYSLSFYGAVKITGLKNFTDRDVIQNYLVVLGSMIPIICGVVTFKVVDMEANAGSFQVILATTKARSKAYSGKLITLVLSLSCSVSLAIFIFAMLFGHQNLANWFMELALIVLGCLATCMIHLWVAMMLGGGASVGLGFVETLITLLAMTGLGDRIWYFLPCTWSSRLAATYVVGRPSLFKELIQWEYIGIPITLVIFIVSLLWFQRWDGKSLSE